MLIKIYPENPNPREIDKVIDVLRDGGLVIYPTDTVYAIGCDALNVRAVEKICQMKGINPQKSNLSIICYDLSNLSEYAKVNNSAFKLMKKNLPGTFHLHPADKQRIAENIQKQERSRYPCAGQQYYPDPGKGAGKPYSDHVCS